MRTRVGGLVGKFGDGGVALPVDPPRPRDLDELYEVQNLAASANPVSPFTSVQISWAIAARDPENFPLTEFVFSIKSGNDVVAVDIAASGQVAYTVTSGAVIYIVGARSAAAPSQLLGHPLLISADESRCVPVPVPRSVVDGYVLDRFLELLSSDARIRLRTVLRLDDQGNFVPEQLQVESTWEPGVIRYYFPMMIDAIFDANLDIRVEVRYEVYYVGDETDIEVHITHSSNVDIDTATEIVSLGNARTAVKTANALVPIILGLAARNAERDILRFLLDIIEGQRLRLLAVRVREEGLSLVFC